MTRRDLLHTAAATAAVSVAGQTATTAQDKPKLRIKQSFTFGTFARGVPPEKMIKEAAAAGYRSIEMGPREHWDKIKDAGMDIAIFVGHRSLTDGLNDKKNHDRIEKELLDSLEVADKYKVPSILVLSGNRRGMSDEEGLTNCVTILNKVIKAAEEKKINLCLELLNSKVDHPDYQCDHYWWGVEVCKRVNSPQMKLLDDLYHMQIMEGDLIRFIRNQFKYMGHFHTAGVPGRRDPDETQEIYYPAVMRALVELGYQGYVSHEFSPKGDSLESMRKTFRTFDV